MKTRDIDIRSALHAYIEDKFSYDSTTRIIDELQVCYGEARVDIAAINGSFYGYEIKSESDTLERLPQQAICYNRVFDYITLVCSEKFLESIDDKIPKWWGVYLAKLNMSKNVFIECFREPSINTELDSFSLVQFLRKDELVEIMKELGADNKIAKQKKFILWETLAEKCPVEDLRRYVKLYLKSRKN